MKKYLLILGILCAALSIQAQEHETPNAQQARRMFMDIYNKVYGDEGATLHYKVNIIGIYKTVGTIRMKQKKSKFIDEKYIATVITSEDLLTVVHQLDHSMGGYMDYFAVACDLMAALLIYLLTKIIIEKNATSISMLKVLGYYNSEVNSLYIRMTTVVVVVSSFVGVAVSNLVLQTMWRNIMYQMSGWFEYIIGPKDAAKMIVGVIVAYILVSFFDMRRVKRIPLTEALKNVE
jgi:putative ABC transport system permease protein